MGVFLISLIVVVFFSMMVRYKSKDPNGFEAFVIRKGCNYSIRINRPFPTKYKFRLAPKTLRFTAVFGYGCDTIPQNDDWNKLYGVSYGFDRHWRSMRIGWRYNSHKKLIELCMYAYSRGKREVKYLFDVELNEEVHFVIFTTNNSGIVEAKSDNHRVADKILGLDAHVARFMLWPYFGGDQPAPDKMTIFIK